MVFINFQVFLYEGSLVTFKYTVDSTDVDQKFIIPNANADTSTLLVKVQNSSTDTTTNTYSLAGGYNNVTLHQKFILYKKVKMVNMKFILVMVLTGNNIIRW